MKSMAAFFVDNLHLLAKDAELHGNLVLAPMEERAKFPTYVTVGLATVVGFTGFVILQAGPLGLICNVFEGYTEADMPEIRRLLTKEKPSKWPSTVRQWRVDISALVQAVLLRDQDLLSKPDLCTGPSSVYSVLRLITAAGVTIERRVLVEALRQFLDKPQIEGEDPQECFGAADAMLNVITTGD